MDQVVQFTTTYKSIYIATGTVLMFMGMLALLAIMGMYHDYKHRKILNKINGSNNLDEIMEIIKKALGK